MQTGQIQSSRRLCKLW